MAWDRALLRGAFLLLALWLLFVAWAQHDLGRGALPAEGAGRPILILYGAGADEDARLVAQLAGRFAVPEVRHAERYRPGSVDAATAAIVIPGIQGSALPAELLADVREARRPVIWTGDGIDQLFDDERVARSLGWAPEPWQALPVASVSYRGWTFGGGDHVPALRIAAPGRVRTLAAAVSEEGAEVPWAIRSGSFAFVAGRPAAAAVDRHLILADLLFELIAPRAPERRRALIRLDAAGVEASPRRLRAMADLLQAERIPFEIAAEADQVSPAQLRARPAVEAALRHGAARGGTLVPRPASGAASAGPAAPYETIDSDGVLVVPVNLASSAEVARHQVVRDSLLSFAHRLDDDPQALRRVIAELRRMEYRFIGPREALRGAPPHAQLPVPRASSLSLAAAGWLSALPWIDLPVLIALLSLVVAMWLGGEIALSRLGPAPPRPARPRPLVPTPA